MDGPRATLIITPIWRYKIMLRSGESVLMSFAKRKGQGAFVAYLHNTVLK